MTTPLRVIALQNAKEAVRMAQRRLKAFERMVAEHDPLRDSDMATAGMINQFAASLTQPTALPPAPPAPRAAPHYPPPRKTQRSWWNCSY